MSVGKNVDGLVVSLRMESFVAFKHNCNQKIP